MGFYVKVLNHLNFCIRVFIIVVQQGVLVCFILTFPSDISLIFGFSWNQVFSCYDMLMAHENEV